MTTSDVTASLELDFDKDVLEEEFDLDYDDESIGDTREVAVIPWSGEVLDFDDEFGETREIFVDPNTGKIQGEAKPSSPPPTPRWSSI